MFKRMFNYTEFFYILGMLRKLITTMYLAPEQVRLGILPNWCGKVQKELVLE